MQLIKFLMISLIGVVTVTFVAAEEPASKTYHLSYLFPVNKQLTFEEVLTNKKWTVSNDGWIQEHMFQSHFWFGDTPKVAWLKLDFAEAQINRDELWIELASSGVTRASLYKYFDSKWYQINSDESQKNIKNNGAGHWIGDSPIRTRFLSFKVDPARATESYYLRVEASDKLHLQVNIKTNQDFIIDSSISNFIYAMGYGILLVMIFYNLFIGITLKDRLYYFYSGAILSTLLYQFFAHGHARLFAYFNWDHVNYGLNFLVLLITTLSMYFLYYFCNIKIYTPKVARAIRLFLKLMVLLTICSIFIPTNWTLNLILTVAGTTPMLAIIIASYAWYKGSPTASIFILSWMAYIIGGFLWQAYWLGLVTLNSMVEIPLIAGAALESILLSLALAYRIRVLSEQTSELKASTAHYKKISNIDPLTKLANRRAFDNKLKNAKAANRDVGLIMFDLDHFKQFNDAYGHPAGDKVITAFAEVLQQNMRDHDLAARIGGEEFAAIFATSNPEILTRIAHRIRVQFNEIPFNVSANLVYCSVSAGVASQETSTSMKQLIDAADKALYKAKEDGRNTVVEFTA